MELTTATDLKRIFEKIRFASRYGNICRNFNDFYNGLRGNQISLYKRVLDKLEINYTHYKRDNFFKIQDQNRSIDFQLNLTLKDGLVETYLEITIANNYLDGLGRFDFIPENLGIEFDRNNYNLPVYKNEFELKEILDGIFSIYEEIKNEVTRKIN